MTHSILFAQQENGAPERPAEPDHLADLHLDQVLEALAHGRERYELEPFFRTPLHDEAAVVYRQEALRDLERPGLRDAVDRFAQAMDRMREHLGYVGELHHPLQKQAWFLDAVEVYVAAVLALAGDLAECDLASDAFQAHRGYLAGHVAAEPFRELTAELERVRRGLASVRYAVRIHGVRVTVSRYEDEPDYSVEVEDTFARFRQRDVGSHLVGLRDAARMDHVEAQILDRVAWLHPEPFGALDRFCVAHREFVDETIARFDREVQFYTGYLDVISGLRHAGLPFCYPHVSAEVGVEGGFDLALALRLRGEDAAVVGNDFALEPPERILVVTGPNNGGKTTFARMFGQLHHLAALGLPIPARSARMILPDRIFTHFEREENIETLRGKFEDELVRVHAILAQATAGSVVVLNESFSSTTLNDALYVGTEVMRRILELGSLGVYVTFVDEIASLDEATVSMVAQIAPENPAERTFKVLRRPADGLAYAWAIADKYGLTYEGLVERIGA